MSSRVTIRFKPNRGGIYILQALYPRAQNTVLYNGKAEPRAKTANKSHGGNKVNSFQLRPEQFQSPLLCRNSTGRWFNTNSNLIPSRLFFVCGVSTDRKLELLPYKSGAQQSPGLEVNHHTRNNICVNWSWFRQLHFLSPGVRKSGRFPIANLCSLVLHLGDPQGRELDSHFLWWHSFIFLIWMCKVDNG